MKFQKKNAVEDETVLVQLERRHTLKEDANEVELENNLRKTTRANSLGSFEEGHSSTDVDVVTSKKQSKCTRKPTVITESELSSSSLYKDRKAKINSDDESIEDPRSSRPPANHEDFEPKPLHDPNLKPVPVANQRPRKKSSCCWYFMIALVISIACLAVMAGIGGIVFMEFFATYDVADTSTPVKNVNPSASKENFQHPSHRQESSQKNEPSLPDNILTDFIKNSTLFSLNSDAPRKTITTSQPVEDVFHSQELTDSKDSKEEELNKNKSNFVFEKQEAKMMEHPNNAGHLEFSGNINQWINNFNLPVSDKFLEIKTNAKNTNSLEINPNHENINHMMNKILDEHEDESNKQTVVDGSIFEEKSNSEEVATNDNEKSFLPKKIFSFDEMAPLKNFESRTEQETSDMSAHTLSAQNHIEDPVHFLSNNNSLGHMKNAKGGNHEDNLFHHRKLSIDHDSEDDSLVHTKNSMDHNPKNGDIMEHTENSADHNPKNGDIMEHTENSVDHNPKKHDSFDHTENSMEHNSKNDDTLDHTENYTSHNPKMDDSSNHTENFMDQNPKNEDSLDHTENSIDHNPKKDDSLDHIESSIDLNLKNSFLDQETLIDHSAKEDSWDHFEHSWDHIDHNPESNSLKDVENFIGHNPEDNSSDHTENSFDDNDKSLNVHDEDSRDMESDGSSSEEPSVADDKIKNSDESAQLVFIKPVVESKAIPVPLGFLRRIGFDIKNANGHQPMSAKDMDIKFSLAEALKYLRTLDADDKLPASREKTVTQKTINQTESKKKKLPLTAEREEYLNTLRKKMFEENS